MISKFEFIDGEKANYPIVSMCRWARVSRSGFYEWQHRPASATTRRRAALAVEVRTVFKFSDSTYGYRRVHEELGRRGVEIGLELVRWLMNDMDLVACQPRPWRITTIPGAGPGPVDLIERDFTAPAPGLRFVGDITYISTWEGWLYLATVIDLCTKEVCGWAMADHMRSELVCDALTMADEHRPIAPGAGVPLRSRLPGRTQPVVATPHDDGGVQWCDDSSWQTGRFARRCGHLGDRCRRVMWSASSGV